jgi:hypothetical protein
VVTTVEPINSEASSPVEISFDTPRPQRRLTVFFRLILVIPQIFVLFFVGIAAAVVLVIGWFGALFTGRLPQFATEFLTGYLRWTTRVLAYQYLLTDKYPPFALESSAEFPVDVIVRTGRMNRWAILFRCFLAIPGSIAAALVSSGMYVFGIVTWVATLVKGETPRTIFEANAAAIRYLARFSGYFYMLTSVYPAQILGDAGTVVSGWPPPLPGSPPAPTLSPASGYASPSPDRPPSVSSLDWFSPPAAQAQQDDPPLAPQYPAPASQSPAGAAPPPPVGYGPGSGVHLDSPWRLVLSSGARKLVVAFFFLGILGYVAYFAVIIPTFLGVTNATTQSISAQNQTVSAYDGIAHRVQSFVTAGTACTRSTDDADAQVQCLEANDATLARAFDTYTRALSRISFPSSVSAQAAAAESAAMQAAESMSHIATAGSGPQNYQAAVVGSNIQSVFNQVDTTFNQLNTALIRRVDQ